MFGAGQLGPAARTGERAGHEIAETVGVPHGSAERRPGQADNAGIRAVLRRAAGAADDAVFLGSCFGTSSPAATGTRRTSRPATRSPSRWMGKNSSSRRRRPPRPSSRVCVLVTLAKAHGLKLATLDGSLCGKAWAKAIAENPL